MPAGGQALLGVYEGVTRLLGDSMEAAVVAMRGYQRRAGVLRAWQDTFVDILQAQLQQLFFSLLQGMPSSLPHRSQEMVILVAILSSPLQAS